MKLLFIVKGEPLIELQLYARTEKEAIAKANKIAPRARYYVTRILQQDDIPNQMGVLESLVDVISNIDFRHNS